MEYQNDSNENPEIRQKVRPFAGGFAQYIVLLNGLILTITAYFCLNYFAGQMVAAERERVMKQVEDTVIGNMGQLEAAMRTTAAIASELVNEDLSRRKAKLAYAVPAYKKFDSVYWIRKDGQGGWFIEELYLGSKSDDLTQMPEQNRASLVSMVVAGVHGRRSDIVNLSDLPWGGQPGDQMQSAVMSRPFILARPLRDGVGAVDSVIIGMTRMGKLFDSAWLDQHKAVQRMTVMNEKDIRPLYVLDRTQATAREITAAEADKTFTFELGDTTWVTHMDTGRPGAFIMLGYVPLIVLVFGAALTVMGTLFVRSNGRQGLRLSAMNQELAQKNYQLNTEAVERERMNQLMRKTEREYRAMIDSVSDIIFESTADGRILMLNNAWERISGYNVENTIGQNLFDLLHPQDQEEQRKNFGDLVKGRRHAYRGTARLRTIDGAYRSVEIGVSLLRQDKDKRTIVVGSFTDIEERRRAEKALGEAEKKYRTIVDNAAGGIFQITPDGTVLSANPSLLRILGFDTMDQMMHEMKNMLDYMFTSSRDRAKFMRDMEYGTVTKNFEVEGRMRDNEKIWLNINARSVRDDEGNILYYEGSLENITQRKLGEYRLRDAKIQSDLASRAKSEFLANMSHELRTPLNAIIGFSEIIKNEVLGPLENRQYWDYAKDIHESGCKLLAIINEILDVSRISAGERHLNEAEVDMEGVVKSCIDFMAQRAEEGRLELINLATGGNTPHLVGEELAIKQILLNLLSNAVKFTPEGGRITVSCEVDGDGQFRLSVTDTGIGLDDVEIEKALSPFGQVDNTFSRSSSGAGLGLTLVDSLIKLHNGRLELFSQKGIGTTATAVFPYKRIIRRDGQSASSGTARSDGPQDGTSIETRH